MQNQGYTAYVDRVNTSRGGLNACSRESSERPLIVNNAGSFATSSDFTSDNPTGRLDYYLMYIAEGRLDVMFPEGYKTLNEGSLLFIPPKLPYNYRLKNSNVSYFWIHFTGSHAGSVFDDYGFRLFPEYGTVKPDSILLARFRNIFDAFAKSDRFRDIELSVVFERLLISLGRRLGGGSSEERLLTLSIGYINTYYNTEIRVPELAKMESISVSRYNTVFRKITGMSPTEYIASLRINSACDLLGGTDLSIKEIGEMVGYSDPHFFSKIFKSRMGISPKGYRAGR